MGEDGNLVAGGGGAARRIVYLMYDKISLLCRQRVSYWLCRTMWVTAL